jgi:hypothetical protein
VAALIDSETRAGEERERERGVRASLGRERRGRCSAFIEGGEERERERGVPGRRKWSSMAINGGG